MSLDLVDTTYREQITNEGRVLKMLNDTLAPIGWIPPAGGHILDAGAFTGITSAELVNYYWELGVHVTGCDLNIWDQRDQFGCPNLVRTLESYLGDGRRISDRLDVIEADFSKSLPLQAESTDAVLLLNNFSYEVYYHPSIIESASEIRSRLTEVSRVLKIGGIIVVWSEFNDAITFVIQKTNTGFVRLTEMETYVETLKWSHLELNAEQRRDKALRDIIAAEKVVKALAINT